MLRVEEEQIGAGESRHIIKVPENFNPYRSHILGDDKISVNVDECAFLGFISADTALH